MGEGGGGGRGSFSADDWIAFIRYLYAGKKRSIVRRLSVYEVDFLSLVLSK